MKATEKDSFVRKKVERLEEELQRLKQTLRGKKTVTLRGVWDGTVSKDEFTEAEESLFKHVRS